MNAAPIAMTHEGLKELRRRRIAESQTRALIKWCVHEEQLELPFARLTANHIGHRARRILRPVY